MEIIMPASEVMVMCETALDRYHTYYENELQQRLDELRKPKRTWWFGKERTLTYDEAIKVLGNSTISYYDIELRYYSTTKTTPTIGKINRIYELCVLVEKTTHKVILTEHEILLLTNIYISCFS